MCFLDWWFYKEQNFYSITCRFAVKMVKFAKLWKNIYVDITQIPIVIPTTEESVLLGSAVMASCASQTHKSLKLAMEIMETPKTIIQPTKDEKIIRFHKKKYLVFSQLISVTKATQSIMSKL